jgi:hypothetical protein
VNAGVDRWLDIVRAMRCRVEPRGGGDAMAITCDDVGVVVWYREAAGDMRPRGGFAWSTVTRICFKDNGPASSDVLYVFTQCNPRAWRVPLEAAGAGELWRQLPARGLFPPSLHERATLAMDGRCYCWPPLGGFSDEAPWT